MSSTILQVGVPDGIKSGKKGKMKSVSAGIVSVLPGHDDVNCLALLCLLIMMDRDLRTCEPNKSPFQLMVFVTAMKVLLTHLSNVAYW